MSAGCYGQPALGCVSSAPSEGERPLRVTLLRGVSRWRSTERFADALEQGFAGSPVHVDSVAPGRTPLAGGGALGRVDAYARRWVAYPRLARRLDADVFHVVEHTYAHLLAALPPQRTIVTCHDLILLRQAEGDVVIPYRGPQRWVRRFDRRVSHLRRAAAVVCESRTTCDDVVRLCEVAPQRVHFVPLGVSEEFRPLGMSERLAARRALGTPERHMVLHVTSDAFYKNVPVTLDVVAELRRRGRDAVLARVGRPLDPELRARAARLGLGSAVLELGHVTEAGLVNAYNAADALVFPSFYEGFGWPVLEAMRCGTPVVCSDTSALVELAGDAALTAPAQDVTALAAALERVLTEPVFAERLRAAGLVRAAGYGWGRAVAGYERVYREVAEAAAQV